MLSRWLISATGKAVQGLDRRPQCFAIWVSPEGCSSVVITWQLTCSRVSDPKESDTETRRAFMTQPWKSHRFQLYSTGWEAKPCSVKEGNTQWHESQEWRAQGLLWPRYDTLILNLKKINCRTDSQGCRTHTSTWGHAAAWDFDTRPVQIWKSLGVRDGVRAWYKVYILCQFWNTGVEFLRAEGPSSHKVL